MIKKAIGIAIGAATIFLLTNILFPEFFQNTILAKIAHSLQLVGKEQQKIYFIIETQQPSDSPQNIDYLKRLLEQQKFAFDQNHNLLSGTQLREAEIKQNLKTTPVIFSSFARTKIKQGDRVIQTKILPRNEYNKFPVDLQIYAVNSDKELSLLTIPTRYFLKAQADHQKSAELIAEFIVNACIF